MKRIVIYIIYSTLGLGLVGAGIGYYLFNKPPERVAGQQPDYMIDAQSLMTEYRLDERRANEKYLGKIIEVWGEVAAIETGMNGSISYSLEDLLFGVTCTIMAPGSDEETAKFNEIKVGDNISFKGRCDGILTDVRISECILVE